MNMNGISNVRLMGERYKNYVKLSSHFLTSIFCILHSRWNVFMVSRQQVQHLFVVCFGSVAKRPVASLFDTVKTEDMFTRAIEACPNSFTS